MTETLLMRIRESYKVPALFAVLTTLVFIMGNSLVFTAYNDCIGYEIFNHQVSLGVWAIAYGYYLSFITLVILACYLPHRIRLIISISAIIVLYAFLGSMFFFEIFEFKTIRFLTENPYCHPNDVLWLDGKNRPS